MPEREVIEDVADAIAKALKGANPNFDRGKFLAAAGVPR